MQFFPTPSLDAGSLAGHLPFSARNAASAVLSPGSEASFSTVYSSFIEKNRTDYSGLPQGFSALAEEAGTISREKADFLKRELKKRNVHDAGIDTLDQLVASGGPVTIGKIFGALSGASRVSAALEGDESTDFMQAMQKLGFTKDEADGLLTLSHEGKTSLLWQKMSKKIEEIGEDKLDLHENEMQAVLKGLDLSDSTRKAIGKLFAEKPEGGLDKGQLNSLFSEANREIAGKDQAARTTRASMREALVEALNAAKLQEISQPSADARGSNRSNKAEQRMHHALSEEALALQKGMPSGADAHGVLVQEGGSRDHPGAGPDGQRKHFDGQPQQGGTAQDELDGKSRAERILTKAPEGKTEARAGEPGQDALQQLMGKVNVQAGAAGLSSGATASGDAQAAAAVKNFQQAIFSQVEQGVLQTAQNGAKQLTLQIDAGELGPVTVMLMVNQGEVRATIRTDNADTTSILGERMAELRTTLEESGLKVAELEVETRLGEDPSSHQWNGTQEHNLMHDAQERARMARLTMLRRDETADARGAHLAPAPAPTAQTGLHIVA